MDAKTTPEYLKSNAVNMPDAIALSYKDESGNWVRMTWSDFYDVTMKMAKSLIAIGFEPGDNLSIYSYNRMEWYAALRGTLIFATVFGRGLPHLLT